ncbi:MAG: hypothetical protein FVQ82_11230 [Planctomycetes bacterium]|nr:hypothetical protein [Planctomycetota bacterium]
MKSFLSFGIIILSALITCCFACPDGDLTGDCFVDIDDLAIIAQQWLDQTDLDDFAAVARTWQQRGDFPVAINEIHYNPDLSYELVEFVELYNHGSKDIDLSQWYFSDGITYTFPEGTTIKAGSYVIVTEDHTQRTVAPITSVAEKYSIAASYIAGHFQGKLNNFGETIELRTKTGEKVDEVDYQLGFPWPTVGDAINGEGTGHSIQLINALADNDLAGSWRSSYPTPAAANSSVYADNTPPHIRQVSHTPAQPTESDIVTISAKATDLNGVNSVVLSYQVLTPGSYIAKNDPAYNTSWTDIAMRDDGLGGDNTAFDSVYSVQMPLSTQTHRNLIRYRITATDYTQTTLTVPYADDPQGNFAYFIYNAVPAWTGSADPGVNQKTYSAELMRSLPVYHLISKKSDVEQATWKDKYTGSDYLWQGTLVFDGKVYDNIRYRMRGGVWRYAMGKNMWKFDFNRGHSFQARDNYGKKYKTKWDKLNFSACIQQNWFGHRGEQGMFEAVGFKMFNLMGIEAPKTHWVQFRVIDENSEDGNLNGSHTPQTSSGTQYDGDLWGLYLVIEQMDGRFLDEHDLPDGNLYKIENHSVSGTTNNLSRTGVIDRSDFQAFKSLYYDNPDPTLAQWQTNVDLRSYYAYRAVVEGIRHGDIYAGKNYFFYHDPTNGLWKTLPWDIDLTWSNSMWGNGEDPFKSEGNIFSHPEISLQYQNFLRHFYDLLYNDDQLYKLIDEYAALINTPDVNNDSFVDVDRAMWDYHWVMDTNAYPTYLSHQHQAGQGLFYSIASNKTFEGMVQIMKDYVVGNRDLNSFYNDPQIPQKPVIFFTGTSGYPANDLKFQTSNFVDPDGDQTFAAMKWRIAEVDPNNFIPATAPGKYEIETLWESDVLTEFASDIHFPAEYSEPGNTYRVRCRMKDTSGRWSHWSQPIEFVATEPIKTDLINHLRVTELMYNNGDADFIELQNTSHDTTLDLSDLSITDGVQFTFAQSNVTSLLPGEFVLIIKSQTDFQNQYGTTLNNRIAGQFEDTSLSNGGENIRIEDTMQGIIVEFEYNDTSDWPQGADGQGYSMVPNAWAMDTQPDGILNYGVSWKQSQNKGGSPAHPEP